MAGFGKSSRGGKRGSSSSTSYASTVSMVVFVAFCLLGVWMLTSSSIIPSHHHTRTTSTSRRLSRTVSVRATPRAVLNDPPPAFDFPEDSVKESNDDEEEKRESLISRQEEKESGSSGGTEEETPSEDVEMKSSGEFSESQQREEEGNESSGKEEESQQQGQEQQEKGGGGNEESQQQETLQEKGSSGTSPEQEEHDSDGVSEEQSRNQSQEQQSNKMGNDSQQQDSQESEQQQQAEVESNDNSEQQSKNEMEESQEQIQQQEDGGGESQSMSEEKTEEEVSDESQSDEGSNESQQQSEQQLDGEGGGGDDEQQPSRQQSEELNDESQQQNEEKLSDPNVGESLPDGGQSEVSNEGDARIRPWATQADQSDSEKERRKEEEKSQYSSDRGSGSNVGNLVGHDWKLCNVTAGPDYIPCLDNEKAIKKLHNFKHFQHRERHCPEEGPSCLVPLPKGYKRSVEWPRSRDRIWYSNVPHAKLAEVKGHQNWVKVTGDYLTFLGGGTQFIHGALHYIDFIKQSVHDIAWGKRTRVVLDVGCGVASFGGYLFERDVLTMSFAPKDEHEAQVQFALERGIPAISAVMGSQRLPFPSRVFDVVHCARCRVPWHADGGNLLLELNRVLRPGGFFVWSATPVYQKLKEDVEIWKAMSALTISMCWDLFTIKKDRLNGVAAAFYRKPISNECYDNRKHHSPPMCSEDDDPNAAWYISLKPCMHRVPVGASERGSQWPEEWPRRAGVPPYWLNSSQLGVYGKPAPEDFTADYEHWKRVVKKSYLSGLGISWSKVRNVMDMRAVYGGFAAALRDAKLWVMNVVNIDSPDTLPIIYERGLFGMYHDWCESFSTYPRTYDLLHADHLFSRLKKRCDIVPVMVEVDRIARPGGILIIRDESGVVGEVENLLKSLHWEVRLTFSKDQEGILCAEKSNWRPEKFVASS